MRRAFVFLALAACTSVGSSAVSSPPVVGSTADDGGSATDTPVDAATDTPEPMGDSGDVDAGPRAYAPPVILATGERAPYLIATDNGFVYWTAQGVLRRAPASGAGPAETVTSSNVAAFAVDGGFVYYLDSSEKTLSKVAVTGGVPVQLASYENNAYGLAVHGGQVYFSNTDHLRRVPVNGGPVETVLEDAYSAAAVAVDDANIYWTSNRDETFADPPSTHRTARLTKTPLAGGANVDMGSAYSTLLALSGDRLAWHSWATISTALTTGTSKDLDRSTSSIDPIAIDDQFVYWANFHEIFRIPFAGGKSTPVVDELEVGAIAVDERWLYATDSKKGTILRFAKDGSAVAPAKSFTACPTPLGNEADIAASPRADVDAEVLALRLRPNEIVARQSDYTRIVRDLTTIRTNDASTATIHDAYAFLYRLSLTALFSPTGSKAIEAKTYSAWDCLNEFYGVKTTIVTDGDLRDAALLFKPLINKGPLAAVYKQLPEVDDVGSGWKIEPFENPPPFMCLKDAGTTWDYYLNTGGDISHGCDSPRLIEAAFRVDASGAIVESYHRDYSSVAGCAGGNDAGPQPSWVHEVCPLH